MSMRILLLILAALPLAANAADPESTCRTRSTEILEAVTSGNFDAATTHFDARMQQALDADKLRQVWEDMLPAQFGAYLRAADTTVTRDGGAVIATTPLEFARGWLDMQVACDAEGGIGGLFFKPGQAPAASTTSAAPGVVVQELAVDSPLGPLPGTLLLPAGKGPFPAVLLVAGSGPNDRDGTIGSNKPLRDIADALADKGIASYRYDKRTLVHGAAMAGKAITVDDEVTDDAVAALQLLSQQAQVDANRVFVLGHSLGGLMAPRIATRAPTTAGVILLAAPVTLDLDTVLRQLRYIASIDPEQAEAGKDMMASIITARDALAEADPAHPPAGEFFHAPASYWLSLRSYDPIVTTRKLQQPVLVLQGDRDYQVTPDNDFAVWKRAFHDDHRVTLKAYPTLSHLFMPAGDPPSPADYANAGHVDAQVLDDITTWITRVTK